MNNNSHFDTLIHVAMDYYPVATEHYAPDIDDGLFLLGDNATYCPKELFECYKFVKSDLNNKPLEEIEKRINRYDERVVYIKPVICFDFNVIPINDQYSNGWDGPILDEVNGIGDFDVFSSFLKELRDDGMKIFKQKPAKAIPPYTACFTTIWHTRMYPNFSYDGEWDDYEVEHEYLGVVDVSKIAMDLRDKKKK